MLCCAVCTACALQVLARVRAELFFCPQQAGQGLLLAALDRLKEAPTAGTAAFRVGVLYNGADAAAEPSLLSKLLLATTQLTSRRPKIIGEH